MNPFAPEAFFDFQDTPAAGLFEGLEHVWEGVAALPAFIEKIIEPGLLGEVEEGAWLEPGRVQLGEGSRVERGAIVRGPTIIGRNTVIRSGASLRGHVMVGDGCTIGHGTEMRQALVLNECQVPHLNSVFTSLIGNRVWVAGLTSTANFLLSRKEVEIRVDLDGERLVFPTGQTHFGMVVGDDTTMGAFCILHPGTLVGRRCMIYSQAPVSGYVPHDTWIRPKTAAFEMVPRGR